MADTKIYLGNSKINGFYLGNAEANEVYLGNELIYKKGLSDGETYTEGLYTYTYSKKRDGWHVKLTNPKAITGILSEFPLSTLKEKNVTDVSHLFEDCAASEIRIGSYDFNTYNVTNMSFMFCRCKASLGDQGISQLNFDNVTNTTGMFFGYNNPLQDIDFYSFMSTPKLQDMSQMFEESNVHKLNLSGMTVNSNVNLSRTFANCKVGEGGAYAQTDYICEKFNNNIITYIPSNVHFISSEVIEGIYKYICDTSNKTWRVKVADPDSTAPISQAPLTSIRGQLVTSMAHMFNYCHASLIDTSSFNTSNITDIYSMFSSCYADTIDVRGLDTSKITQMTQLFEDCHAKTIKSLNYLDTSNVTDMSLMFCRCTATSLDLSSFNTSQVYDMEYMFEECTTNPLILSSFDTSQVSYMRGMFKNCSAKTIKGLQNFNTSEVYDMGEMFYGCQVPFLDLSSFNTSNVHNMDSMFKDCQSSQLDLTSFDTTSVRYMDRMFASCSNVKILDLGSFDFSNVNDMSTMFYENTALQTGFGKDDTNCYQLNEVAPVTFHYVDFNPINLPIRDTYYSYDFANDGKTLKVTCLANSLEYPIKSAPLYSICGKHITDMSDLFDRCYASSINLSDINTSKVTNMSFMFNDCMVYDIDFSSFDTSNVTNMRAMFQDSRMKTLDLSTFDISNVRDMDGMFNYCDATVGYAKDQATCDKFNNGSVTTIPSTLHFVVKS